MKNKRYLITNLKIWTTVLLAFCIILLADVLKATIQEERTWVFFILYAVGFITIIYIGYLKVYRRYKKMNKLLQLYVEGYLADDTFLESLKISPIFGRVLNILAEKLDKIKVLNLSKKQAQYLALQNQINPHFLYNTLESIRSEALCAGVDGVASMTEALATFFRYTISNIDQLVTLEDELANIENYYIIQKYRFGDKLNLSIEYGEELTILDLRLPKLILQPIVENAIYHGIEEKMGQGFLRIRIYCTKERLIIRVSDDGVGIDQEKLNTLNNKLLTNSLEDITDSDRERRGGIAILNVNNRIKLLFGEEYGIYIQSKKHVGSDVEITLPVIKE
jgi:two-component system, sensor histidine kinase YesM